MAKQNLLLVDADLRSLRVLEVSLRKAGYNVASIGNARDALGMLEQSRPDLVLCDTRLPGMDGFELIQEMRKRPELADVPLMILSSDVSVETKVRGLQLGVEDYLTKPIYIKELLARVSLVLQRKRREGIEQLDQGNKRRFSGSLSDMGVVDLLQAVDHNKKSGVLYLRSGSSDGAIYFRNGAPVDATVGPLHGSRAIYRALLWTDGTFEIDFREVDREDRVQTGMQALLMEGLRRVDEWGRLLEQLPDMDTVFEVSETQLFSRLGEIPDQINSVLREVDSERSLWQVLDACDGDDLETLNALSKLYFEGLLFNTGRRATKTTPKPLEVEPEPSEIVLPHISSGPPGVITHTLAPAWPSVPSGDPEQTWTRLDEDTFQINIPSTPRVPEEPIVSLSQPPKRKGRKRKRRGASQSQATEAPTTSATGEPDDADAQEVDESVAEITPSTIAPPRGIAEAAKAASLPPPLPPTSMPATPRSWPAESITSEVSLAQLTDAGELHATPPPLPSVGPRASIPDAADITLLPGAPNEPNEQNGQGEPAAPTANAETARPVGPATLPPLSATSSAPPGPTTLRPQSALDWEERSELPLTAARQRMSEPPLTAELDSGSDEDASSGPLLDAEAAADLSLADSTESSATTPPVDAETAADLSFSELPASGSMTPPLSAAPRLMSIPPLAMRTERPELQEVPASTPPTAAESSAPAELDEIAASRRSSSPPPLPIAFGASEPRRSLTPPPVSDRDGSLAASLLASANEAGRDALARSLRPTTDNESEATLLAASRASIAPAPDTSQGARVSLLPAAVQPPDFDAAAARLAGAKRTAAAGDSVSPSAAATPSLRHHGSPLSAAVPPATTAMPPPFSAIPSMSRSPSARAAYTPQYRTDVPPAFSSAAAANDNASGLPPVRELDAANSGANEALAGQPQASELSDFAKVALALNSTTPEPAPANDSAGSESSTSHELLSAALSTTGETGGRREQAQSDAVEQASEAPQARNSAAPRSVASAPPRDSASAPPRDSASAPPRDSASAPPRDSASAPPRDSASAPPRDSASAAPKAPASEAPKVAASATPPPAAASVRAPHTLSEMPTEEVAVPTPMRAPSGPSTPQSQGVWSDPSKAPSTAAPAPKRRSRRWMQVGSVAAATALAAGLYALRARDAAPEASLIRAVPEAVATQEIAPKPAASNPDKAAEAPNPPAPEAQNAQARAPEEGPELIDEPERPANNAAPDAPTASAKPTAPEPQAEPEPQAKPEPQAEPEPQPSTAKTEPTGSSAAASAEQALAKGRSLEQKGKKKDALALYEKTVAEGGGSSQLLSHIAFMYLNQGNNAQAAAQALKASVADETNSEAWIVLGAARAGLGEKQAAAEAYRSCASKGLGQYVMECRRMLR